MLKWKTRRKAFAEGQDNTLRQDFAVGQDETLLKLKTKLKVFSERQNADRDRQTATETERQTDREGQRETDTDRDSDKERQRDRQTKRQTETERQGERHTERASRHRRTVTTPELALITTTARDLHPTGAAPPGQREEH